MNYIYDILLNFNKNLYEFYDWNLNDNIEHIRKIPVFKIDHESLWDIKNNKISFSFEFLNRIEKKTEIFTMKNVKHLKYACIFCDGMEAIAILIDNKKLEKSKLLLDEEEEVLDVCSNLDIQNIEYKIEKPDLYSFDKTRKEIEMEEFVEKQIKNLEQEQDMSKLYYLYYECFNEKESDPDKIVSTFQQKIYQKEEKLVLKLYRFFKLLQFNQ